MFIQTYYTAEKIPHQVFQSARHHLQKRIYGNIVIETRVELFIVWFVGLNLSIIKEINNFIHHQIMM